MKITPLSSLNQVTAIRDSIHVHETAADWFVRREQPQWTGADERVLNAWLAADPAHRHAFDALAHTTHDLHLLPLASTKNRSVAQPCEPARQTKSLRRRWAMSAALGTVCVMGLLGVLQYQDWQHSPIYEAQLTTEPGEAKSATLPDGTQLELNRDSSLHVRFTRSARQLTLEQGEAFFQVTADAARPFTVDVGTTRTRVIGTAFNLRRMAQSVELQVLEGRVEFKAIAQSHIALPAVGPGMRVTFDGTTFTQSQVEAATVGEWRHGQIHFKRTELAAVAEELSRYLRAPVHLAASDLARLRVSGVAATDRPDLFLLALPDLLPVQVRRESNGSWRIMAAKKP